MKQKKTFELFGIFGHPLEHSLSPVMQGQAFAALNLAAHYLMFDLEPKGFRTALKNLGSTALKGFNLTVPYKEKVIPYLDRLTPEAKKIGAVNTVYRSKKQWLGTNTDVYGFLKSLEMDGGFKPKTKVACVFGAGGAARAVVYGLAESGAKKIYIVNRSLSRARKLLEDLKTQFSAELFSVISIHDGTLADVVKDSELIVNATSLGLKKADVSVLSARMIPKSAGNRRKLFYDLIYCPAETRFLKEAKKKGHRAVNGVGMLVHQGAKAFECWTGKKAPVSLMRRALLEELENRK